jgi:hypothetical protein
MLFLQAAYWLLSGLALSACLLALWKGDAAARSGGAVILGAICLERLAYIVFHIPRDMTPIVSMAGNGLTAVLLLALAVRFTSPWIGGAMLFYAAQFALHAFYFVTHRASDILRFVAFNVCFFGVIVCLLVGAITAWRRRVVSERLAAA